MTLFTVIYLKVAICISYKLKLKQTGFKRNVVIVQIRATNHCWLVAQ